MAPAATVLDGGLFAPGRALELAEHIIAATAEVASAGEARRAGSGRDSSNTAAALLFAKGGAARGSQRLNLLERRPYGGGRDRRSLRPVDATLVQSSCPVEVRLPRIASGAASSRRADGEGIVRAPIATTLARAQRVCGAVAGDRERQRALVVGEKIADVAKALGKITSCNPRTVIDRTGGASERGRMGTSGDVGRTCRALRCARSAASA